MLELEDGYRHVWEEVVSAANLEEQIPKLEALERALRDTLEGILEIARRYVIDAERWSLN
ncbi:hypothetical protein AB0I10_04100 [Streptomyces sp. NPDC050636]|uniref:hypothetical protein n=1 Tax=Streptomyces sp. NPDC050636 TaxID=3154510 RepID=UPI003418E916